MDGFVMCSAKKACELMGHMDDDDMVILCVLNKKTHKHNRNKNIQRKIGEELIGKAEIITYQDNDYFGTLSLYGILKDKDVIHNLLFPQLE